MQATRPAPAWPLRDLHRHTYRHSPPKERLVRARRAQHDLPKLPSLWCRIRVQRPVCKHIQSRKFAGRRRLKVCTLSQCTWCSCRVPLQGHMQAAAAAHAPAAARCKDALLASRCSHHSTAVCKCMSPFVYHTTAPRRQQPSGPTNDPAQQMREKNLSGTHAAEQPHGSSSPSRQLPLYSAKRAIPSAASRPSRLAMNASAMSMPARKREPCFAQGVPAPA